MRHGIGSEAQRGILLASGVGRLWLPTEVEEVLALDQIAPIAFRPDDVIVMVQPKLIAVTLMRRLARLTPTFEVLGHAQLDVSGDASRARLRELPPMAEAAIEARKGGNVQYNQPTEEQAKVIVGYWHGSMKPREFRPLIREMMQEPDLPDTVVRDWIKKWTGNTKRSPDDAGKLPFNYGGHKR